jgi:hypothetical protein
MAEDSRVGPFAARTFIESHRSDFRTDKTGQSDYYKIKDYIDQKEQSVGAGQISAAVNGDRSQAGIPSAFADQIQAMDSTPTKGDPRGLAPYIRKVAAKYGVDPGVAVNVARSEGLEGFTSGIPGEHSYTAFQLNMDGGLGNEFQKETGLDPRDPKNERQAIDWALHYVSGHGWSAFHGAKNRYGYGPWQGVGQSVGSDETLASDARKVDGLRGDLTEGTRAALISYTYDKGDDWMKGPLGDAVRSGDEDKMQAEFQKLGAGVIDAEGARRQQELSWFQKNEIAEKTEQQRVQEGLAIARAYDPNNVALAHAVEARIRTDYTLRKQQEFDAEFNNKQSVAQAVMGTMPDGKVPTTPDDLKSMGVGENWAHLKPTTREQFLKGLHANAMGGRQTWDDDSLRLWTTLKGQAKSDPDAFIKEHSFDDLIGLSMPVQGKKELINLMIAAKNNPDRDPSLNASFGKLRVMFPSSVPDPATDKDLALQYKGLLYDALAAYKKQFPNKDPSQDHDTLEKIGKSINIQIAQPGALWGTTQVPIWQADVPPEVAADGAKKGLDQDTVARHYRFALLQQQWKKLGFQGAAKTNGKATPTPGPPSPPGTTMATPVNPLFGTTEAPVSR